MIPLTIIPLTTAFPSLHVLRRNRQRNVRQRNNSRHGLFPIPLPNIPLPVIPLPSRPPPGFILVVVAGCRAVLVVNVAGAAFAILLRSELWRTGGCGGQGGEMAQAQDLKIHFEPFYTVSHHRLPCTLIHFPSTCYEILLAISLVF
jgi:hypothetical protein